MLRLLYKSLTTKHSTCIRSTVTNRRYHFKTGDSAELTKTFSADDVLTFSSLCGDTNPLHLDEEYAKTTRFGRCIVHGVLINGLISAVLGTKLPGPGAIFMSQDIKFPAPLYVNESVTAAVEILDIRKSVVVCSTTCTATGTSKVVMSGKVYLMVPKDENKPTADESS
ncbi:hydroxyacyl-thioester dehydratase type 2, mitochondrial-like [Branchiostoma lanceolatum]|uniref:hydroxyacyl-thioester dehydratase type 2, mitochondrial-like n=1 Tax=Branchiostoma lanceolatum TaxID=7740 RepID=UPI003452AFFB